MLSASQMHHNVPIGYRGSTPEEPRLQASQGFAFLSYGTDPNLHLGSAQVGLAAANYLCDPAESRS